MDEKKFEQSTVSASPDHLPAYGDSQPAKASLGQRFIDSFKRDPNANVTGGHGADGSGFDIEGAAANTAASPLQRRLKGRHLQMIAIGGSIGKFQDIPRAVAFRLLRIVESGYSISDLTYYRYWSLRRFRLRPGYRWSCVCHYRLLSYWCHVVLHSSRAG